MEPSRYVSNTTPILLLLPPSFKAMEKTVVVISPKVAWSPFTPWNKPISSTTEAQFPGSCSTAVSFFCNVVAIKRLCWSSWVILRVLTEPRVMDREDGRGYLPSGDCVFVPSLWWNQTETYTCFQDDCLSTWFHFLILTHAVECLQTVSFHHVMEFLSWRVSL